MTEIFSPESINQLNKESFISRLGICCTHVEDGLMEATMPVNENNCQPLKMLHGGASLTLAETLAGCGSYVLEKGSITEIVSGIKEDEKVLVDFNISGGEAEQAGQQASNPFMPKPPTNKNNKQQGGGGQPK